MPCMILPRAEPGIDEERPGQAVRTDADFLNWLLPSSAQSNSVVSRSLAGRCAGLATSDDGSTGHPYAAAGLGTPKGERVSGWTREDISRLLVA